MIIGKAVAPLCKICSRSRTQIQCNRRLQVRAFRYYTAWYSQPRPTTLSSHAYLPGRHRIVSNSSDLQRRCFGLSSIPGVLLPPIVFGALLVSLWTYKCLMMIIFQNKIIYMPSMPPFSRSEKAEDYANASKPVIWTEHTIRSLDGTKLKLLEGIINKQKYQNRPGPTKHVIVLYFQGNGSSLPPRLPYLSNILKQLAQTQDDTQYTVVGLSYRGFWQSYGRPSQRGIELDAQAAMTWAANQYNNFPGAKFVLWGQSIGAGVATTALATSLKNKPTIGPYLRVSGLLLETPFTSLRAMLIALYPQKLLPYRYLGPFLSSTWDSEAALSSIGTNLECGRHSNNVEKLRILLLEAGKDELVPTGHVAHLSAICHNHPSIEVDHKSVAGALHTNVMMKGEGKKYIVRFLSSFRQGSE